MFVSPVFIQGASFTRSLPFTPSPHILTLPLPPPARRLQRHLLGDAGCCVVNKSLLYQRPPLSRAPH